MSRPGAPDSYRVAGTTDLTEIAAVLAAVSSALSRQESPRPSGYELWRRGRVGALRASLRDGDGSYRGG